ncbi:hypothetical protein LJC41_03185 [Desulfosarcina sp. OttesenSCG-928-G17]|nr:hypothetical protein [Desulfosarcina sp. OttesenSCG-928-G17]
MPSVDPFVWGSYCECSVEIFRTDEKHNLHIKFYKKNEYNFKNRLMFTPTTDKSLQNTPSLGKNRLIAYKIEFYVHISSPTHAALTERPIFP